jgi:hypothetical protein
MNNKEWNVIYSDNEKFECFECKHVDDKWVERDDLQEWNVEDEAWSNEVRCPNCKSWLYWNIEENENENSSRS